MPKSFDPKIIWDVVTGLGNATGGSCTSFLLIDHEACDDRNSEKKLGNAFTKASDRLEAHVLGKSVKALLDEEEKSDAAALIHKCMTAHKILTQQPLLMEMVKEIGDKVKLRKKTMEDQMEKPLYGQNHVDGDARRATFAELSQYLEAQLEEAKANGKYQPLFDADGNIPILSAKEMQHTQPQGNWLEKVSKAESIRAFLEEAYPDHLGLPGVAASVCAR